MLKNAYLLAKIGADTAENERHFAEILPIGRRVADLTSPRNCQLLGVDADRLERGAHRGDLDVDALRAVQVQHVQISENAAEKCLSSVSLFVSGAAGKSCGK